MFQQGMETIFRSALTDPSLFHALSLVLSLAANNNLPNVEVLSHRGGLLAGIQVNIHHFDGVPRVSTLTAMLLLIGYEYRIDGADGRTIAAHIKGLQAMMRVCKERNIALVDEVQRALFWQDLLSCLMAGTTRYLSHRDFMEFRDVRAVGGVQRQEVPVGFGRGVLEWPVAFAMVLRDLNDLCGRVDAEWVDGKDPLDTFHIDNVQANLESRIVDLLSGCRSSTTETDPWYQAAILGAYICTYKLSTGIWAGCYIPEVCIGQILQIITRIPRDSHWTPIPGLLQWLLLISGSLTDRKEYRKQIADMIREMLPAPTEDVSQTWAALEETLINFIWCKRSMEQKVFVFWQEVYPMANSAPEPEKNSMIAWRRTSFAGDERIGI
jgi:hypothetical protein